MLPLGNKPQKLRRRLVVISCQIGPMYCQNFDNDRVNRQSFTIQRTGLPELTLVGTCIAEQKGVQNCETTDGRYHDICVYQADDGQLIVEICYTSPVESELSDSIADAVENLEIVDDMLSLYDHAERLSQATLAVTQPSRAIETAFVRDFDNQVIAILKACETPATKIA